MPKSFIDNLRPSTLSKSLLNDVAHVVDCLEIGQDEEGLNILLKLESDMKAMIEMAERDKDIFISCNLTNDRNFLK